MEYRFLGNGRHVGALLNLVPSIFLASRVELGTLKEGVLFWEKDLPFPKSLENELWGVGSPVEEKRKRRTCARRNGQTHVRR